MNVWPVINMKATGRRIVELREAAGMSVKDIQSIFGFSTPQAIYKWQRGTALPTVENLIVLGMMFGVRMEEILVVDGVGDGQVSA